MGLMLRPFGLRRNPRSSPPEFQGHHGSKLGEPSGSDLGPRHVAFPQRQPASVGTLQGTGQIVPTF